MSLLSFIFLVVLCLCLPDSNAAQTSTSSDIKRGEIEFQVKLQLLVASNIVNAKTDYPPALESVVKQIKSSLSFKNHFLYATYLYNVADNGNLRVSDVSYKPYESAGTLAATFFNLEALGVKSNINGNSTHISRFKFEERKNIFIGAELGNNNEKKSIINTVGTFIDTELNVKEGIPTIVGTTTSALSDGALVIVITVTHSEM
jgi:hypothetical protein